MISRIFLLFQARKTIFTSRENSTILLQFWSN